MCETRTFANPEDGTGFDGCDKKLFAAVLKALQASIL
jgi:hypothetical protein